MIRELGEYRKKIPKEGQIRPQYVGAHHACLIAGTIIETVKGGVAIENIQEGDMVLTRKGYKKVLASKMTKKNAVVNQYMFSDGRVLGATPDHPVFTAKGNSKEIFSLTRCDTVYTINILWKKKQLFLMGKNTEDIHNQKGERMPFISNY